MAVARCAISGVAFVAFTEIVNLQIIRLEFLRQFFNDMVAQHGGPNGVS